LRTSRTASSRLGGIFDYAVKKERLEEVTRELENPKVWDDPKRAQELGRERSTLDGIVTGIDEMSGSLADSKELLEMAAADGDDDTVQSIVGDLDKIDARVSKLEFQRMFSGELDSAAAFVDVQAGAGGTEARTGPKSSCACTCAGRSRAVGKPR
jgi:peptide chain release factor 2